MIINHRYKFIFVHVPKNAGTSVTQALSTLSTWNDLEIGGTQLGEALAPHFMKRFGLMKHSCASEIRKVVGEVIWNSYFKFAFARDPHARVASLWSFLNKWRQWPKAAVMSDFKDIDEFICSDFFKSGGPDNILKPQSYFIDTDLDFLGSCSRVPEDFQQILTAINVEQDKQPSVGTLNSSESNLVRMSDKSQCVLADLWSKDFELMKSLDANIRSSH